MTPSTFEQISPGTAFSEALGAQLGRLLGPEDVVVLNGPLGAGKTALVRGIARGWGSLDRVTSPTYVIVQQYGRPADPLFFWHLDCYRLTTDDDAETIGLDDIFDRGGPVVIEWGERIKSWLPADHLCIDIEIQGQNERRLTLTPYGERSTTLLTHLTAAQEPPT